MGPVTVPVDWRPRAYQLPLWKYLEDGGKRAVAVWHRRAGKDATALNWTVTSAFQRPGLYWHLLPTYNQGRKIVWNGRTKEGRRFIDAWPGEAVKSINNTEMTLELKNNSIWQVVGTDNVDRLVGANPVGCVFSEYSLQDPKAWDYIRPILAENGGWALFIYTSRGRNHGHDLYEMARQNPQWFAQKLTVDNTGAMPMSAVQEERDAGMPEEMIQQEFYCSFDAALVGSYYAQGMAKALDEGRITSVYYDQSLDVHTVWDIGVHDSTTIWFYQTHGNEIRLIDFYENSGEGLQHYIRILREKDYVYGKHYAPHDIEVREFSTQKTRKDTAAMLGLKFTVCPRLPLQDGIDAVRGILNRCVFDAEKCSRGIEALRQYKKSWNDKMKMYNATPDHDWTSHAADAFRYLAVTHREKKRTAIVLPQSAMMEYNPFE
jgi:phage terminase large subunit